MLNHVWQTILQECEAQLTRRYRITVSEVEQIESTAALPPTRGRRVLIGAVSAAGPGLLAFSFPESVCRTMVHQTTGQEPIDCSEQEFNDAVLSFCMRVLDDVRQTGPAQSQGFGVTPPVILRSTSALVGTAGAACDTRLLTTERGAITVMSMTADPSAACDEGAARRSETIVQPVPQAPQRNPGDPPRILIVDDDPQACRLLATGLRNLGWTADVAHRGQSALGYLERNVADMILLDYDMPGMDGLECLQAIRDLRGLIPVIMITAAKSADVIKRSKALGAVDYIIKPYKIEHVKDRIVRALELEESTVA